MSTRLWMAALAVLLSTPPALAEAPACHGALRGAVEGTFRCTVELRGSGDAVGLTITALGPVGDAPSLAPGGFQLPAPLRAGRYGLGDMLAAKASVIAASGTLYSAAKTSRSRGEVTLTLVRVVAGAGALEAHGTLHAVLQPAGSARQDTVTLEVEF